MKIHMIGICGVAMGSLACMLKETGHEVSGSDEAIYPPMSEILIKSGIEITEGFSDNNIDSPDLVVIGNALSRGNPEVEYVLDKRIPYSSMASTLYDFFLKDRDVVAVCGTHGKSTTSALISHILYSAGEDPSFFVGGNLKNYSSNYMLGNGRYFIIEGDEYDSAFFEKVPKFFFYRPRHLVLTSLEFDHADIYSNVDEIKLWFKRLVNSIPSSGNIVCSGRYPHIADAVSGSFSNTISFSGAEGYHYEFQGYSGDSSTLMIHCPDGSSFECRTSLLGKFNYENIIAAAALLIELGIDIEEIQKGIESFSGVLRRQDVIYRDENIIVFEDFAHHPTAVKYMLESLRHRYPDSIITAIYEPRSATSKRNVFQKILPQSFINADRVYLKTPSNLAKIPECDRLNPHLLCSEIKEQGLDAFLFDQVDDIAESFTDYISYDSHQVAVIMSNGGFDGIYKKIVASLNSHQKLNI